MEHVEAFIKAGIYLRSWSPRTVQTYRQAFASIVCWQTSSQAATPSQDLAGPNRPISKVQFEAWIVWLREKGLTPGGINMYLRTVNSYLSWKHTEELTDRRLRLKLLPDPKRPLAGFSKQEVKLLSAVKPLDYYEGRTVTLALLLADTGLRITEALTLEVDRIHWDNLYLEVCGKGSKWRQVPFSIELRKRLWRFHQARQRRGLKFKHLFCTESGTAVGYFNAYRDIKALSLRVGIAGKHVHPHAFRHFFAVSYIRNGGDIYRLSRILGHASISTTQIYLRSMGIEAIQEGHSQFSPLSRL